MPTISNPAEVEQQPTQGGGGPGKVPRLRGFGGGDNNDDRDRNGGQEFLSRGDRLRRYRVGVALCIISVTMVFVAVASAYIFRKGVGTGPDAVHAYAHPWKPLQLPYRQLLINSLLLLLSSITLELARRTLVKKAEFVVMGIRPPGVQRELPWLTLTVLLAFGFLGGQLLVWDKLRSQGIYLHTNPSSQFFYLLTGLHAVHLIGGLLVLLYALLGAHWIRRQQESRQIVLDATGWYWHFMGLLWFAIFALLHFFRR